MRGRGAASGPWAGMRRSGRLCKHTPPRACARPDAHRRHNTRTGISPGAQPSQRALPGTGDRPSGRAARPSHRAAATRGCDGGGRDPGAPPRTELDFPGAPAARAPSLPRPDPRIPSRLPALAPRLTPTPRAAPPRPAPPLTSRGPDAAVAQQRGQQQPGGRGRRGRGAAQHRSGARPSAGAQGGARGAERVSGGAEPCSRGGNRGPPPGRWAARSGRERLPSSEAALRWRQRLQLRWRRRSLSGPTWVPDWGRGLARWAGLWAGLSG